MTRKNICISPPAIVHINAQTFLQSRVRPIVLVLAPRPEGAVQIRDECINFERTSQIRNTCVYGRALHGLQIMKFERGVEIELARHGRLIYRLESVKTNLRRVTHLVLDETDRLLHIGLELKMHTIIWNINPHSWPLLFTRTWPKEVMLIYREGLGECIVQIKI